MKYCGNGIILDQRLATIGARLEGSDIENHPVPPNRGSVQARDASCPTVSNGAALLFLFQDFPTTDDETKERFCLQQMECPSWRRPLALSNEALLNCITDSCWAGVQRGRFNIFNAD